MDDREEKLTAALRQSHTWEMDTAIEEHPTGSTFINNKLMDALEQWLGCVPQWIRTLCVQAQIDRDANLRTVRDLRPRLPPGFVLVAVKIQPLEEVQVYGYSTYDLGDGEFDLTVPFSEHTETIKHPDHFHACITPSWMVLR